MRFVRGGFIASLLLTMLGMLVVPAVSAQSATPVASPSAVDPRFARLGGSLDSFEATYGTPDYTEAGLVRFNSVELNGIPTILVVYNDDQEQVTKLALVYSVRPASLTDTASILALASTVAPSDGVCESVASSSAFGAEVYPCQSRALMTAFTAEQLDALGALGPLGAYSVSVDPLPDNYFEIVLQLGVDANGTPVASAVPAEPTATPVPTLQDLYPFLNDPRSLMNGDIPLGDPLSFTGSILTLQVAEVGKQFKLGEDQSLAVTSLFQVEVPVAKTAETQVLFVGYNGDASGLAIGERITVYGTNYGTQCFTNQLDEEICQPLIAADQVEE